MKATKHTKNSHKEDKDSAYIVLCLADIGKVFAINGNNPDIDGIIEVLIQEEEQSTGLSLEYQLKTLNPSKNNKTITIPRSLLVRGAQSINPVIVCAIGENGENFYYSYLSKKFCNSELARNTKAKSINIFLGNKISKNFTFEQKIEARKVLIRIAEFHKNKHNDNAIAELIKVVRDSWDCSNGELVLDKIKILKASSFLSSDDGSYSVKDFVLKNILDIFLQNYNSENIGNFGFSYRSIIQEKLLDLLLIYEYEDPDVVVDILIKLNFDIKYSKSVDKKVLLKIKKELIEISKHRYQILKIYDLKIFNILIAKTKELDIKDYDFIYEVYSNLLDIEYSGTTPSEDDKSITFHRGVLGVSKNLKSFRMQAIKQLFDFYNSSKLQEDRIKIIKALGKVFENYHNQTNELNALKIKKMNDQEIRAVNNFLINTVLQSDNEFDVLLEAQKATYYKCSKNISKAIDNLGLEYELFSLFALNMWHFKDFGKDHRDVESDWIKEFTGLVKKLNKKSIIYVFNKLSNRGSENNDVIRQIVLGSLYLGENLGWKLRDLESIQSYIILPPLLAGIYKKTDKILDFKNSGFYNLASIYFNKDINTSFLNNLDFNKDLSNLSNDLFIRSLEGFLIASKSINNNFFNKNLSLYLSNKNDLSYWITATLETSLIRQEFNFEKLNIKNIDKILNLYSLNQSISHNVYGEVLSKIAVKYPKRYAALLSKRIKDKKIKKQTYEYYESLPSDLNLEGIISDDLKSEISNVVITYLEDFKYKKIKYLPFEINKLFKYADIELIDEYVIKNLDNEDFFKDLISQGLGSDTVTLFLINNNIEDLAIFKLRQYMYSGIVYSEEEKVLVKKHIDSLLLIKRKVNNKKLINKIIAELKTYIGVIKDEEIK